MKRKVISLARSTNVVSLPQKWCEENKIKKGDEINLDENLNSIVISPLNVELYSYVDVTNMDPMIKRILGAFYKSGFDKLKIKFSTKDELKVVEEVIREEFIGFEIVSSSTTELIAKSISDLDIKDFNSMLRRLMLIIVSMLEDILVNINNKSELKSIALRDKEVNKIADFCRRIINKNSLISIADQYKRTPPLYYIVEQLEKVSDEVRDLALSENIADFSDLIKEVKTYYSSFYDLFYRFEMEKIAHFGSERYRIRDLIDKEISKKSTLELTLCRNIVEKTFDMNGALISIYI